MKLFGNGIDFRSFLIDVEFWNSLNFKNKHQLKTALSVMYGRKKDRGHIKQKYKKLIKDFHSENQEVNMAIYTKLFGGIGFYGRF